MKRTWIVVGCVVIGSLLAGFLLLIPATNILLSTSWLRKQINAKPEKTFINYAQASCRWPGRIHLRGISIRSRDKNVEWLATIEDASIDVELTALLKKRFHVRTLEGSGLSFRLRERLDPKEAANGAILARTKSYPPISGFSDPPVTDAKAPVPETPDKIWTVDIEKLSLLAVKEIWVDDFRYHGSGTLNGGFFLKPTQEGQVYPSRLTLDAGRLELGERTLAAPFRGFVTCTLPHFSVPKYMGNEIWKIISGRASLSGETPDLAFVNTVLSGPGAPRFEKGTGPLALKLDLHDGAGSASVEFDFKRLVAQVEKVRLAGAARGALVARSLDFRRDAVDLDGTFLDLEDVFAQGTGADRTRAWWGRFEIPTAHFDMKRSTLATHVSARCRDARPLFALFDVDLPGWARGLLTLDGLKAQADVRVASKALNLSALHAAGGAFKIDGRYRKTGRTKDGAFLVQTTVLNLGVKVDDSGIGLKLLGAKKWFEDGGGRIGDAAPDEPRAAARVSPSTPATSPTPSRSDRTRSSSPAGSRGDSSPRERAPESRIRG